MTDHQMQTVVGRLLQAGVLLSAAVVIAGGAWMLASSGSSQPEYKVFRAEPAELRSARKLVAALTHPRPEIVVQFGLILLIATPVARVAFTMVAFAFAGDRMYVAITCIVLVVLAYSLAIPHGG